MKKRAVARFDCLSMSHSFGIYWFEVAKLRQFLLSFDRRLSKNEQEIEKHATSVCYIDATIQSNAGRHANSCRHFVGEFRRRGFVVHAYVIWILILIKN